MSIFDFSKIPSNLLTVDSNAGPYMSAGILHNVGLCKINDVFSNIDLEPETNIVAENVIYFSKMAESNDLLTRGSTEILNEALKQFLKSSTFEEGIIVWNDFLDKYKYEENYKDTLFIAILSIGYYSAQFWSFAIENNDEIEFSRWLQIVCADLKGALSGAQIGIEIASITGMGKASGAVFGAVLGGEQAQIIKSNLKND
jgi:hypothetical protein